MKKLGSSLFTLSTKDLLKGLVVVVITSALTVLLQAVTDKGLALDLEDWKLVLQVAVTSGAGYLLKNWLTDSNDKFLGKM